MKKIVYISSMIFIISFVLLISNNEKPPFEPINQKEQSKVEIDQQKPSASQNLLPQVNQEIENNQSNNQNNIAENNQNNVAENNQSNNQNDVPDNNQNNNQNNVVENNTTQETPKTPEVIKKLDKSKIPKPKKHEINPMWYQDKQDEEIKKIVLESLHWYNEWQEESYQGIENLNYGFNNEGWAYGGLVLIDNPYELIIGGYQFISGPAFLSENEFDVYFQSSDGIKEVYCGKIQIQIPNSIESEVIYEYYHN